MFAGGYTTLQNSWVQTRITQRIANNLSERLGAKISVGKVDIGFLNKIHLEDVLIQDRKNDTLMFSHLVTARIDTLRIKRKHISIDKLSFKQNKLNISRDTVDTFNFAFLADALDNITKKDTAQDWNINCNHFDFGQLTVSYTDYLKNNETTLYARDLNLNVSDFYSHSDSLSFKVNHFSVNDGNKLYLKDASAEFALKNKNIAVNDFRLKSNHSEISQTNLLVELPELNDSTNRPANLNISIGKSSISFKELGELVPALKGMTQKVEISGLVYGNLNDLKGKNLVLNTGAETKAIFDFYINDLTDTENMYLFLDLKQSETSFKDISNIRFPNKSNIHYLDFPESFYEAGQLKFRGNFSGFLTDFVTFGTFESEMGILTTDILVTPQKDETAYYRGNVSTTNFDLGRLFQTENLGKLTFSGSADGNYKGADQSVSGIFKGDAKSIELNGYNYKNIKFDGVLLNKMFDGLLAVNDPNLQFSFLGELDLNNTVPRFDFDLNLVKALPNNLNISQDFPDSEVALKLAANFTGDKIDNLNGTIVVEKGYYKNQHGQMNLGGMKFKSVPSEYGDSLSLTSDFFDATLKGTYHFRSIANTFNKIIHHYLPSFRYTNNESTQPNIFNYSINVKDINSLAAVFVPGIEFETPFLLYGNVDSPNNDFQLKGSIPGIKYNGMWARHIFIGNQKTGERYASKFRISELFNRKGLKLYNFTIDTKIADNVLDNAISWSNYNKLTYSGLLKTQTTFSRQDSASHQHIEIKGYPSGIYLADTLWSISPFLVSIDSSSVSVNNFKTTHGKQSLSADGKIVEGKTDLLNLKLENIDLSYFDKYLDKKIELEGIIDGTIGVANIFDAPLVISNLDIRDLHYKKQFMGDISLLSHWDRINSTINSELKVMRNNMQNLHAFGYLKPSTGEINYNVSVDSLSLLVLETFMKKNFSNIHGTASGKANLGGTLNKIAINGALLGNNAGLKIKATQVPYHFTDTVYFRDDTIHFDNITIYDDLNNPGIFDGTIVHENFNNMVFNLHLESEKIRALNTTSRDNDQFYGEAIANGRLEITGANLKTILSGTATSLPGSEIFISMESEKEIEQYDFIEFVTTEENETIDFFEEKEIQRNGEYKLSLTVEATPDAKVQLIYNSQLGDIIKAQGEGILLFEMDHEGNMALSGNYNPTKGDYLFTLQNVVNKRFSIEPGGSIIWSGDPYNAIIDLKAIYKLKASLYDVFFDRTDIYSNQRIQVECIIELEEELANPAIEFDVNFPNAEERIKDDLSQFFNTEEEMNKQILSLIVLGKFYTPEYLRGSYEAQNANMVGTTASEVLSNQLSNLLSQINTNWDVGVNYRPGNQVTDDEIELALSTQIFNDRVTLNGNIGNNTNQYSASNNNSSQIVGDFEMNVKLVPSGKILFKAYNRSNNNLYYETAPYTQGVGLSFKEEYNTIDELLNKILSIFKKRKK